jgi:hypothetical protein
MAAANNLDGSPPPAHAPSPAMKKIRKKKSTKPTAASSVRRQRPTIESLLIEAVDLLGIMLKDRQQNNSRRRKRCNAESSIDRERRRAYKIEAKKRAKIEAKATRDKQLKWSEVAITFDKADCKDNSDLSGLNPIVVQPVMCGRQVHDVVLDGGSSLNILNAHILDEMCIFPSDIEPVIRSIEGVDDSTILVFFLLFDDSTGTTGRNGRACRHAEVDRSRGYILYVWSASGHRAADTSMCSSTAGLQPQS